LLPYWYSLSRNANLTGEPIVRPLWWEFNEEQLLDTEDKVMVGKYLLVAPFLDDSNNNMKITLPKSTRWYNYFTKKEVQQEVEIEYNGGRTPVFIRGGGIIPIKQRIRKSSELMFYDPFTLIIALDENNQAQGEIYVDDGKTFNFAKGEFIHKKVQFLNNCIIINDLFNISMTSIASL